jgi:hypothetical protein
MTGHDNSMTSVFDNVAASLADLPETARTRRTRAAWKHGIALRDSGITDIPVLIESIMPRAIRRAEIEDVNDFITESILCATSFCGCCGVQEERDVSGLLRLFQIYVGQ